MMRSEATYLDLRMLTIRSKPRSISFNRRAARPGRK
jgi:hypothetical protein